MNHVADELLKPDFKPDCEDMTHILYLSKWESGFNFEDKIEKTGKLYMEERITQNFFES